MHTLKNSLMNLIIPLVFLENILNIGILWDIRYSPTLNLFLEEGLILCTSRTTVHQIYKGKCISFNFVNNLASKQYWHEPIGPCNLGCFRGHGVRKTQNWNRRREHYRKHSMEWLNHSSEIAWYRGEKDCKKNWSWIEMLWTYASYLRLSNCDTNQLFWKLLL